MNIVEFRKECIKGETAVEGGYVNDPSDLGGETNHGITKKLAISYKSQLVTQFGWDGTMMNLTEDMAYWLYSQEFWHPMHLDDIFTRSKTLAHSMFRWGLKSGSKRPVSSLQESLNVLNNQGKIYPNIVADGYMGPKTKQTIDSLIEHRGRNAAMKTLVFMMNCDQVSYMKDISLARANEENEKYTWGWVNRCQNEVFGYIRDHD